jgi:hypothetical protein
MTIFLLLKLWYALFLKATLLLIILLIAIALLPAGLWALFWEWLRLKRQYASSTDAEKPPSRL